VGAVGKYFGERSGLRRAAVSGFGGVVTNRLPISAMLGAAAQGLVLCATAGEHGVHDEVDQG
jgi:hypothetical protein